MAVTERGAALDPASPEYDWIRAVIGLVEKNTGQASRWNGTIFFEEGAALGTADADGNMSVSDAKVLTPLRRAFAGEALSDDELFQLRDALVTLTHESLHLSGKIGHVDEHGRVEYTVAGLALEEGLTETWSQQNVDNVIYALGLDQKYSRLVDQPRVDAYPALQAASTKLVQGMATLSGLREGEVVRRLQDTEWNKRFGVLADLVIEQRLSGLYGDKQAALRAQLEKPLREHFGRLMAIQEDKSLDSTTKAIQGTDVGSAALADFSRAVSEAELAFPSAKTPPQQRWWQGSHPAKQQPSFGQSTGEQRLQRFLGQGPVRRAEGARPGPDLTSPAKRSDRSRPADGPSRSGRA
jgi:hypothetical protein